MPWSRVDLIVEFFYLYLMSQICLKSGINPRAGCCIPAVKNVALSKRSLFPCIDGLWSLKRTNMLWLK